MHHLILVVKIGKINHARIKNRDMRNKFFIWLASALLLFAGCAENEIENEQPMPEAEGHTLVVTASMPDESPQTRLSLTPDTDSKNIIVKWNEGDVIYFVFKQGFMTLVEGTPVTLRSQDISSNGKVATFTVTVPPSGQQGFKPNESYTIYAIHGASFVLGQWGDEINVNVSPVGFSLLSGLNDVPTWGMVEVTPPLGHITIGFEHLGVLQCLNFKNSSGSDFTITPTLINEGGTTWYHTYSGGNSAPHYDLIGKTVASATVTPSTTAVVTIPSGDPVLLAQWVIPKNVNTPEIKLNALTPGGTNYVSVNSKPARGSTMQKGKAYHLYALWDGSKLNFTDNTFTPPVPPPTGDLMHAGGGNDFIGVVYSKGDGNVYYNSTRDGNNWLGETLLGEGTEARMAIDGNNHPHVVFTNTADSTIAYRKYDGTSWSATVYIVSNNVGTTGKCSKPDIDVDGSGYAHITYTDTKGGNPGTYPGGGIPTDLPNIMYATNKTGTFVKAVVFDGYVTVWEEYYYIKGSRIAVDAVGKYYIIAHKYAHMLPYQAQPETHTYSISIQSPGVKSGASATSPTDQHDLYDVEFDSTKVVALYKDTNGNRIATINISGTTASFINPTNITTPSAVPHSLSHNLEIAGLSGSNNLFYKYSTTEGSYQDITVKANTEVAAVNKGSTANKFYAVYSDNADSRIKVKEISTTP